MPTIAHLSDVHFGRHDRLAVDAVLADLALLKPTLVVVSGDLTQRARREQFRAARQFLDAVAALGVPWLAVPGNHDVPLYNLARRLLFPLRRYRRYITADVMPRFAVPGLAVVGVNTARSLTVAEGSVSARQRDAIVAAFDGVPGDAMRVLVTHHPLVRLPWGRAGEELGAARHGDEALAAVREAGISLLLAGHHHRSFAGLAAAFRPASGGLLLVQAGTATSTRVRNEANSYNFIRVEADAVEIEVRVLTGAVFGSERTEGYRLADGDWRAC